MVKITNIIAADLCYIRQQSLTWTSFADVSQIITITDYLHSLIHICLRWQPRFICNIMWIRLYACAMCSILCVYIRCLFQAENALNNSKQNAVITALVAIFWTPQFTLANFVQLKFTAAVLVYLFLFVYSVIFVSKLWYINTVHTFHRWVIVLHNFWCCLIRNMKRYNSVLMTHKMQHKSM